MAGQNIVSKRSIRIRMLLEYLNSFKFRKSTIGTDFFSSSSYTFTFFKYF